MTGRVQHLAKTKHSVRPLPSMVKVVSLLAQRMSSYCLKLLLSFWKNSEQRS